MIQGNVGYNWERMTFEWYGKWMYEKDGLGLFNVAGEGLAGSYQAR